MMFAKGTIVVGVCACILSLTAACVSGQPSPAKGQAVAIWNFDEGSGSVLKDSSGHGHHGAITEATWIKGSFGSALRFDGKGYVKVPDSPELHLQPPYTLGVWFRTTSSKNNGVFLLHRASAYAYGLYLYGDSLALSHCIKAGDGKTHSTGIDAPSIVDGTWHHLVGTCEKGKMRIFLDGQFKKEVELPQDLVIKNVAKPGPGGDVFLGRWFGAGSLKGEMGKAYILRKALSKAQVKGLFEKEQRRFANRITVSKTTAKPVIDGRLDEACWRQAEPLTDFRLNDYESTPAKKQTIAYMCYDDENLYIGIKCKEPNMAGISASKSGRDNKRLYTDDCVEIFILPQKGIYYQFLLNSINAVLDIKHNYQLDKDGYVVGGFAESKMDYAWNCKGFTSKTFKGKGFWLVEAKIPFSEIGGLPRPVDTWQFNIAREEKQLSELSSFSPLFGDFHQPEAFSSIAFQDNKAMVSRGQKELVFIDKTPGIEEVMAGIKAGEDSDPSVFVTNYLERGYPTTLPKDNKLVDTISLFAALGEYEPATFSIRAGDKALQGVQIIIADDLKNEEGSVIPKENVDIRVVERWKRRLTTRKSMYMERYLQKKASVDIPIHVTQRFWLTVRVPENARSGIYHTKIAIAVGQTPLKTLDLKVEVLPFQLDKPEGMGYFMYFSTRFGLPKRLRTQKYMRRCIEDMKAHGMTAFTLYSYPYAKVNGKRQFTLHVPDEYGQPAFVATMNTLLHSGMLGPGMPVIWIGADVYHAKEWKGVLSQAKKRNWPEVVFYMVDEPGDDPKRLAKVKRVFGELAQFKKQYPQYSKLRTTAAGIGKELGHLYDIWITGAGGVSLNAELVETAKEMGKEIWTYDCNTAQIDAETSRYYYGLWVWKSGAKGAANWAYSDRQTPTGINDWDYIDKHLENVEICYSFVYPSPQGPVPSIGWEAIREGIDDYRYVATLTKLIGKAKTAGRHDLAAVAEKVLKEMKDKVDVSAYQAAHAAGAATGRRLGTHFDRPSPQANISKEDYNRFRYRVAQQIMALLK